MKNIKLLHQYVLLKPINEEQSQSGLILAGDEGMGYGEVIEKGSGRITERGERIIFDEIEVGDKVMYKQGAETKFSFKGERYILINETSLVMVYK